ncbi:hypothetical protein [Candidatus Halobonum tyrrellensis]|uniref:Uncharacterized protein n=1 Tax=Candidatus Halobonum tyrrellensis G22 TaxID=1324957 RepID=V4HJF2_9EURY|nr:hypothetical protein [Candidatus Halobonum tyrrellensis]ESP89883.1 hypothetical protein K933_01637 [Candidatus Halobonum tyrrellensis G22]
MVVSSWLYVTWAAAAVNIALLSSLTYVWGRNWLQFHSKHTLGLAGFAVCLLAENATALYLFYWHPLVSEWIAAQAPVAHLVIGGLRVLELVALAFLVWVTWD